MRRHRRAAVIVAAALFMGACGTRVEERQAAPVQSVGSRPAVTEGPGPASAEIGAGTATSSIAPAAEPTGTAERPSSGGGTPAPPAGRPSGSVPGRSTVGNSSPGQPSAQHAVTPSPEGGEAADPRSAAFPDAPVGGSAGTAKSPVTIGTVLPRSGPIGQAAGPGLEALQVWSRMVNERGGVNGHQVNLIVGDDGGDPARHRSIVQEFVERRSVIAFVQNFESLGGEGSVAYLTAKRIPVVGSIMGSQYFYEHPTYFPQGSSGDMFFKAYAASIAQQAKAEGKQRIGILACAEVADCKTGADLTDKFAKEFGLQVSYRADASLVAPDYTAQCLNARNAGVEILLPIFTPDGASRIAASCVRQAYHPIYGLTTQTFGPLQVTDPNMQGSIIFSPVFTWVAEPATPAVTEFNQAMARYLPGTSIKGVHAVGWTSAKLFERGAARLAEPPTAESLLQGLWAITDDDLGGLTQPLTFNPDRPAAQVACWFTSTIKGNKLTAVGGGRRSCR